MDKRELGEVTDEKISEEQGTVILDKIAEERLGVSGSEFVERWDSGNLAGLDHVAVMEVAALLPLAR